MGQVAHSAGQLIFTCQLARDKFCQNSLVPAQGKPFKGKVGMKVNFDLKGLSMLTVELTLMSLQLKRAKECHPLTKISIF